MNQTNYSKIKMFYLKGELAIIILAAGQGKRMNNPGQAKVMTELVGKPLIDYVLDTVERLEPDKLAIVVGHQKQSVIDFIMSKNVEAEFVEQKERLGTGHACLQSEALLNGYDGDVLILAGDVPLVQAETLLQFISNHQENASDVSVLSTLMPNPSGYGRIIRDKDFSFVAIVEERDAAEEQKQIQEINSGIFLLNSDLLFNSLKKVGNNNAQKEYYLTDIVKILKSEGKNVFSFPDADFKEIQGINTIDDLSLAEGYLKEFSERN